MEPFYVQHYEITDIAVDRYGRLKPGMILFLAQEVAGQHCNVLSVDYDTLAEKRMFWAVTRHRVQISRLPLRGETIRIETWPMPTTRVAYPRSVVAYDEEGRECFRAISLWVLMDLNTRKMVLPGKSGLDFSGIERGGELAIPGSLAPVKLEGKDQRTVRYCELDLNGHMSNTRYLDWMEDLLPSAFHREHPLMDFTVTYLSEAREGEVVDLSYALSPDGKMRLEAREHSSGHRVFAIEGIYG